MKTNTQKQDVSAGLKEKTVLRKGNWVRVDLSEKETGLAIIEGFDPFGTFVVRPLLGEELLHFQSTKVHFIEFSGSWAGLSGFYQTGFSMFRRTWRSLRFPFDLVFDVFDGWSVQLGYAEWAFQYVHELQNMNSVLLGQELEINV